MRNAANFGWVAVLVLIAAPALGETIVVGTDEQFQEALDSALPKDKIIVKPGNYTGPFTMRGGANVKIIGKGKPVVTSVDPGANGLRFESCQNIRVQGFVIDGTQGVGLQINLCNEITVLKCSIVNTMDDAASVKSSSEIVISKCEVADSMGDGITLEHDDTDIPCADSVVTKTRVSRVNGQGIRVIGVRCTVSRCTITDTTRRGIAERENVPGTGSNVFTRNRVSITGQEGILAESRFSVISKNRFSRNTQDAMDLEGFGCTCTKNKADTAELGISAEADEMVVEKNTLRNLATDGLQISGVNGFFKGNKVQGCDRDGVVVQVDATANILEKNVVSGADDASFVLVGSQNTLIKNKALDVGDAALDDQSANGNTLNSNNF